MALNMVVQNLVCKMSPEQILAALEAAHMAFEIKDEKSTVPKQTRPLNSWMAFRSM